MRIIKKGKQRQYHQHKRLKCDDCKTRIKADFQDCFEGTTVLNIPAYYVKCPTCGNHIHYCYKYFRDR